MKQEREGLLMTETAHHGPGAPLHRGVQKALGDWSAGIPCELIQQQAPTPLAEPAEVDFGDGKHHLAIGTSCQKIIKKK